ncbi:hypothetical protein AB0C06_23820 [Micromonospora inaquosa]|uniref:hypothetical protein n=1 Tax=Micromonospora inaquosa TaxID=2203716 RepID=UPI0013157561|nr:hypothetical protein [Micromonospora inaquosa]
MHVVLRLRLLEAGPLAVELAGPPIRAREQAAANDRLLAQARRRAAEHLCDGPTR